MGTMRTVLIASAVAGALAACSTTKSAPPTSVRCDDDEAAKLLIDRNWIDRIPESHADRLHVYRFVPSMGGGVYQDRTLFKGTFELFTFEVDHGVVRIVTPEDGDRHQVKFHIDRITDGDHGTDLRLTLEAPPRGPSVYYGWSRETASSHPAEVTKLGLTW
jgi:hypothetical protein